jgi:mRNA interferase RelE/StbE
MTYRIVLTPTARHMLRGIPDLRIRRQLAGRIDRLAEDPEKQGKPLLGPLAGYRSLRGAGRYRIIYRVDRDEVLVFVVVVGIRREHSKRDIYALAKKLLGLGLVEPPPKN